MKTSYASILIAAALPAFAQVVIEPSAGVELDPFTGEEVGPSSGGNADPSVGPGGKCPPGTVYKGEALFFNCFFTCGNEEEDKNDMIFPMDSGTECFGPGGTKGICGGGLCMLESKT
jgi:hypothetical protein